MAEVGPRHSQHQNSVLKKVTGKTPPVLYTGAAGYLSQLRRLQINTHGIACSTVPERRSRSSAPYQRVRWMGRNVIIFPYPQSHRPRIIDQLFWEIVSAGDEEKRSERYKDSHWVGGQGRGATETNQMELRPRETGRNRLEIPCMWRTMHRETKEDTASGAVLWPSY